MAKKNIQDSSERAINTFVKGLNKDSDPTYVQEGMWTHARNAVNNTVEGNLGTLSNEISNFLCSITGETMPTTVVAKYIIGAIHLYSDKWIVYTAGHNSQGQPTMSEIGLFEEDRCIYRPIVQDACLGFDKRHLISGASREKEDCTWQVYWADGLNPDRYLNVGDPKTWPSYDAQWNGAGPLVNYYTSTTGYNELWPGVEWNEDCTQITDCTDNSIFCKECVKINSLNCSKIRLARLMETPCLKMSLGNSGGEIRNGSYFALIAYAIKGQKVSDYFSPSNVQPVWSPNAVGGALVIEVEADSENFEEFILVIVANVSNSAYAKKIGVYSTKTTRIELDQINPSLDSIPLSILPIQTPVFEKSDQIAEVNDYLLRVGPTTRFDFNYQPLANQIKSYWASVEYPADYYINGGSKPSYLRDEVYAFFIRFVYDTGDKSSSYHIPGRAPQAYTVNGITYTSEADPITDKNNLQTDDKVFEVYNTANQLYNANTLPVFINPTTDDGGKVIAAGEMGYWQSTEIYPTTEPEVWNASCHCWTGSTAQVSTQYDLCGTPIRHHKFPDNLLTDQTLHFKRNPNSLNDPNQLRIRLMGVYFDNIVYPKDNDGNDIPGIVGYEILRSSREGNKTIIAKGLINNFRTYEIRGNNVGNRKGLYANYPFNTIKPFYNSTNPLDHNYSYNDPYIKIPNPDDPDKVINQGMPKDIITFHSPDLMFRTPFLSASELKLYGYMRGISRQQFLEPGKHPKFKLLSDASLIPAFFTGLAEAVLSLVGTRTYNTPKVDNINPALYLPGAGATTISAAAQTYETAITGYYNNGGYIADAVVGLIPSFPPIPSPGQTIQNTYEVALNASAAAGVISPWNTTYNVSVPKWGYLDPISQALYGVSMFSYYFTEGFDTALRIIKASIPFTQYALQMISYGQYTDMRKLTYQDASDNGLFRFSVDDQFYIKNNVQEVPYYQGQPFSYSINNLQRQSTAVLRTEAGPEYNGNKLTGPDFIKEAGNFVDQSLTTIGHIQQDGVPNPNTLTILSASGLSVPNFETPDTPFSMPIASHYAAIKDRISNQYGQLDSIKQIIATACEQKFDYATLPVTTYICKGVNYSQRRIKTTPIIFGGDTYINRYTEKNNMFFFYDWLYNSPDGTEFNYLLYQNINQPRFWANSSSFDSSDATPDISNGFPTTPGTGWKPTKFYNLDYYNDPAIGQPNYYDYTNDTTVGGYPGVFRAKDAYFYLASSSVIDFFVESDVIIDFRQAGDYEWEKFYDPYRYTNLPKMFEMDPASITEDSLYRYDYSLSISKMFSQYLSSGNLQSRYYNPKVSKLCYTYYPDRIYYSLPVQFESFKDSWFVYLVNNYKEFQSQISGVKSINKNGLFITFKNSDPIMYQGVDTLQTDLGTKVTIGDGGLFTQPQQSAVNADKPYEYGSSQNRLSIISTPAGIYYISQNQGKVFQYGGSLKEISQQGMKWWFNYFMPYKLTEDFPEYPYQDNAVAGIGCQSLYDNDNSILYFTKKDYKLKPEYIGITTYVPIDGKRKKDYFVVDTLPGATFLLGDPLIFDDASWTISYDPKNDYFISFHDWHPGFTMASKTTFLTIKDNGIWKHNSLCDTFCKFYGTNYPFEIELPVITGQTVTTMKSVEYMLESYRRSKLNCVDQFHVLDHNFDRAVIYNTEQISGYLNLNIYPKNNIPLAQQYPKLNQSNLQSFDILFSKEENKYRFNQFWDITKDRGEFPIGSTYPPTGAVIPGTTVIQGNYAEQPLWITSVNGYVKDINSLAVDYNKPELQRKKFRHYLNYIHLYKEISGDVDMIVKIVNTKSQISLR